MVVDRFGSITHSIREFVRLVLVEVYRNDHCDSLYLLDGDTVGRQVSMVLDACRLQYFDVGYGTG